MRQMHVHQQRVFLQASHVTGIAKPARRQRICSIAKRRASYASSDISNASYVLRRAFVGVVQHIAAAWNRVAGDAVARAAAT